MGYPYNYEQRCAVGQQRQIIADQKLTIKRLERENKKLKKQIEKLNNFKV